ncbi:MAG: hypothetical protein FJ106_00030 [Deltaproteobacteria bacterium]|nr:hypothetical protein [Deltaproteobacteria bacterium]
MSHCQKSVVFFLISIMVFFLSSPVRASDGFTQKDRELLITLKVKVEEIDKRFEQIDKRFEQIDKRFEQFGKQIGQLFNFLWIFAVIFTSITVTTIGFAIWDRRSMIRPFESKVKELEEGKIDKVISSLRALAETDARVAEALRRYNLL